MTKPDQERNSSEDQGTGLPLLRSWPAVYWFVLGVFATWVALLTWLTQHFA